MPPHSRLTMDSPLGPLAIGATQQGVASVSFCESSDLDGPGIDHAKAAVTQLREYFAGDRSSFDLPLDPVGTPFQRTVWDELTRIPFGETISYASLAQRIGDPKAVRAVGAANGRNPIAIVVPCHRVIGSGGELRGYGGEVWRKEELLRREGAGLFGSG